MSLDRKIDQPLPDVARVRALSERLEREAEVLGAASRAAYRKLQDHKGQQERKPDFIEQRNRLRTEVKEAATKADLVLGQLSAMRLLEKQLIALDASGQMTVGVDAPGETMVTFETLCALHTRMVVANEVLARATSLSEVIASRVGEIRRHHRQETDRLPDLSRRAREAIEAYERAISDYVRTETTSETSAGPENVARRILAQHPKLASKLY